MANFSINISDFRYEKETAALIITIAISAIILVLSLYFYIAIGITLIVGIILLFINLYSLTMTILGISVKVSPTQFPRVYQMAQIAADRLDMKMPPVYILQSPELNAFASGFFGNYFVVIHSALLEIITDEELLSVIGHEFTHVKGNHVMITIITQKGASAGSVFPLFAVFEMFLSLLFSFLSRCFEYTCDRGGLVACGDIRAFITSQTKLAIGGELFNKINLMEFFKQAMELQGKTFGFLGELQQDHPLTVNRIRNSIRFYRSDKYRRIASMQGRMGTSTLIGSLATGDLMQKIISKPSSPGGQFSQSYSHQENQAFSNQGYVPQVPVMSNQNFQSVYQGNMGNQSQMGFCKKCGTPIKVGSRFCSICGATYEQNQGGAPLNAIPVITVVDLLPSGQGEDRNSGAAYVMSEKICPKCGARNSPVSTFCTECGERI